jgi:hypothetical protein
MPHRSEPSSPAGAIPEANRFADRLQLPVPRWLPSREPCRHQILQRLDPAVTVIGHTKASQDPDYPTQTPNPRGRDGDPAAWVPTGGWGRRGVGPSVVPILIPPRKIPPRWVLQCPAARGATAPPRTVAPRGPISIPPPHSNPPDTTIGSTKSSRPKWDPQGRRFLGGALTRPVQTT